MAFTGGTSVSLQEGIFVSLEFVEEFGCHDASLVVLRVELLPVPPIVVVMRPVLEGNVQTESGFALCPVPYDVPPRVRLGRPCAIHMQDRNVGDQQSWGQVGGMAGAGAGAGSPLGSNTRREGDRHGWARLLDRLWHCEVRGL